MMDSVENVEPEKEAIHFHIDEAEQLSENVSELVKTIKSTAEEVLFHWKTFPIFLPHPVSLTFSNEYSNNRKKLDLKDLFILPTFDELDTVALDVKGEQRKLNKKQLWSIRDKGEFEVDSVNFPGQVHQWKLSRLLQKGTTSTKDSLLKDLALAVRFIIITAKNRFHSEFLSLSQSLTKFAEGLLRLLDIIIGVPSQKANDLQAKLREERSKFLVAELVALPNLEDDLDNLCLFVKHQIRKQSMEKYSLENERLPKVPYLYMSPKGVEIDLRLFDRNVMKKALSAIAGIIEREAKGWFPQYREKVIFDLKARKLGEEEIERLANLSVMDEFMDRISNVILHNEVILELGNEMGMLLIRHAWSIILMHRAVDNVYTKLFSAQNKVMDDLVHHYPILSLIGPWVKERLKKKKEKFLSQHRWSAHEEALMLFRTKQLYQASYFLQRDLIFMREREPVLLKELSRVKTPTRLFHWGTQIWFPQSWKVTRVFQGQTEIIPTIISQNATSITNPRANPNQKNKSPEQQAQDGHFGAGLITVTELGLGLGMQLSLRALFFRNPFMPDLELSQVNGTLFPRKSSNTQTLYSRLVILWRHISKSRTEFESKPDTDDSRNKSVVILQSLIWMIVIQGCIQPIIAIIIACIMCPFLTFIITLFAAFRYACRMVWDGIMYHIVIKRKGRIPAVDSFIVKRIAGPGLSSNFFYRIRPEQSLLAFETKLEIEELNSYKDETKRMIFEPLKLFSDFVSQVFDPFSASLHNGRKYAELEKECHNLVAMLEEKVEKRKQDLQLGLTVAVRSKIKLPMQELKLIVKEGAKILEMFYPTKVLKQLQIPETEFWESKGIAFRDWTGLSAAIFSEIFSPEFLVPLEETDLQFRLEVRHLDLSKFVTMLATSTYDLSDVTAVNAPKGNIHVTPPYIDMTTFNPRGRMGASVHKVEDNNSMVEFLEFLEFQNFDVNFFLAVEYAEMPTVMEFP
ncbi:hypothetical protein GQR58_016444 [Nymphon striatum]|nr:hypothetical protein GQR58_016444 [Nymphon striatum]